MTKETNITTRALTIENIQEKVANGQSLILPTRREILLTKLNSFKTNNLNAKELGACQILIRKTSVLLAMLCWSKLGVSGKQLKKLEPQDLNELAEIIYEQSKMPALIQTGILACVPIIGWIILYAVLQDVDFMQEDHTVIWRNMRYYWWYKRMKNKYGKTKFEPEIP